MFFSRVFQVTPPRNLGQIETGIFGFNRCQVPKNSRNSEKVTCGAGESPNFQCRFCFHETRELLQENSLEMSGQAADNHFKLKLAIFEQLVPISFLSCLVDWTQKDTFQINVATSRKMQYLINELIATELDSQYSSNPSVNLRTVFNFSKALPS